MSQNNNNKKILVCEDSEDICLLLSRILINEGFQPTIVGTGEECLKKYSDEYSLLILDVGLPGINGIEVLKKIKQNHFQSKVIVATAYSRIDQAVEAIKIGADNYVTKPFNISKLIAAIKDALSLDTAYEHGNSEIIHSLKSSNMVSVIDTVNKVSDKNVSIFFNGESGCGKELVAKYAHAVSDRKNGPFIPVNCPAIPATLFESEIFGHEKGAFTGASQKKIGKIEQAHQGILFFDEVADLSSDAQAKLLRVLQEKEVEPLGSGKRKKIDFRVFSASSKNLRDEVSKGNFRLDLFYRLADVEIKIPSLHERSDDIPLLVEFFNKQFSKEHNCSLRTFSKNILNQLQQYPWPGNIRELRSAVRRLLILLSDDPLENLPEGILLPIEKKELDDNNEESSNGVKTKELNNSLSIKENEKELIEKALEKSGKNITEAAKLLNIGRTTLYRKIKLFKIEV